MIEKQENPNIITAKAVTNALNSLFASKQKPDFEKVVKYILSDLDCDYNDGQFLIISVLEYLYYEAPGNEQNLFMVFNLINAGIGKGLCVSMDDLISKIKREGQGEHESDLDRLFGILKKKDENHIAVQHYEKFYAITREKADSVFASCARYFYNLCSDVIKQIYEETIIKLPEDHYEFETIHNANNGLSLYEQFDFKPDEIGFRILKSYAVDKAKFESSGLKGKWEDFRHFAKVFENIEILNNYDEYYNFLQCKKIIETLSSGDYGTVLKKKRYRDTEGALMKLNLDSEKAKCLIMRFCEEIGIDCEPITAEDYEDYEKQQTIIRQEVQKKVIELKKIQDKTDSSWIEMDKGIKSFLSSINSSIKDMEMQISDINSKYNSIYEEEEKIKELYAIIDKIKDIKKKIEEQHSISLKVKEHIEYQVYSAESDENTISLDEDNTEKIFSEVSSIYDDVSKCKSAFVKFENESKNLPTSQVNNLKNQFNSKIKEIKEARTETINEYHSELTQNIQKQKKPITKWFVWGQVFLLIAFWIVYYQKLYATENLGEVFLGLNIVGLICYIIFVIKQFNKYNKAVKEKNDLFIKKEDYYPEKKLIGNIILACIVFAFVQFIFLLAHYHLFESLRSSFSLQLILISAGVYFFIRVFIKKRQK